MTWQEVADFEKDARALEADEGIEAESEAEARERMTPAEREADLDWIAARYGIPKAEPCKGGGGAAMSQKQGSRMTDADLPLVLRDEPTDEEYDRLRNWVTQKAGLRRRAQPTGQFQEVDFFAGAMSVFFALGWRSKIPAAWIFAPMAGRSILDSDEEEPADPDADQAAKEAGEQALAAVLTSRRRGDEDRDETL